MKSKRGSHVGFVISFIMFVTFIIFMYVILISRVDFGQKKENSLNYIKEEAMKRFSEDLTSISVSLNNPGSNCVDLTNFLTITGISNRFLVRSDSGSILDAGISGQDLQVDKSGNTFFRIYESQEFNLENSSIGVCQALSEGSGYTIGFNKDSKEVFESKVLMLFSNYSADYQALKTSMGVLPTDEFGFIFTYSNGTRITTAEKELRVNIYAERIPIQYVKTDASIESGFIDVVVW